MTKPLSGPCKVCGAMFKVRGTRARQFCSMRCYISSDEFKKNRLEASAKGTAASAARWSDWEPLTIPCIECGTVFRAKPVDRRKYCSSMCYRKYMAKRFDRYIANPEKIALPQAYDEFLTKDTLHCLIEGCDWSGNHLSLHMNQAHGISARQFKKLAGFNLSSGIVSKPLHEALCERPIQGNAASLVGTFKDRPMQPKERYISAEAREHSMKTRALIIGSETGPVRTCLGCNKKFTQRSPFGKAKFHSIECRDAYYALKLQTERHELSCVICGSIFSGSRQQYRRAQAGSPVVCGTICRGSFSGSMPKPRKAELKPAARGEEI